MGAVLMVQGTSQGAGTSLVCAAFCRYFRQTGYRVAPFGAKLLVENVLALDFGFLSWEQFLQAEAACLQPAGSLQPVILVAENDAYRLYIHGKEEGEITRRELRETFAPKALAAAREALEDLRRRYDLVVVDGGGNPGENKLLRREIVSLEIMGKYEAPVLLVADIEWGGMFAAVAGTLALLAGAEKARLGGVLVNRFRGRREILQPGLKLLEELVQKPVLGVLDYYPQLPAATAPAKPTGRREREEAFRLLSSALQERVDIAALEGLLA